MKIFGTTLRLTLLDDVNAGMIEEEVLETVAIRI